MSNNTQNQSQSGNVIFPVYPNERLDALLKSCSPMEAFQHNGIMYLGNAVEVIKNFIKNNPEPADFHVWLQRNCQEIK